MAGFTAPKLMWLARHEPEVRARVASVLLPKDYLRFVLTGEKRTDMSDAAGTWWLDEAARRWSRSRARRRAASRPRLFRRSSRVRRPSAALRPAIADELGLPRDVVVAAGGGDAAVGAVALGAIRPGDAFISLGTASQLDRRLRRLSRRAGKARAQLRARACPAAGIAWRRCSTAPARSPSPRGSSAATVAELEREASADYRGPGELLFLPYLSGERTPHDDPHARGVVFGLDPASSRADLTRAVMEGVAFTLADARECLEAAGDAFGRVGLIGGGAKSALWTRMIAAALDREIVRYRGGETGPAFGAARLARLAATGEPAEEVCKTPEILDVTAPDPRLVDAFAKRREGFANLYRALRPEFSKNAGA